MTLDFEYYFFQYKTFFSCDFTSIQKNKKVETFTHTNKHQTPIQLSAEKIYRKTHILRWMRKIKYSCVKSGGKLNFLYK